MTRRLPTLLILAFATLLTPILHAQNARILLGIDHLEQARFAPLQGKRVGLLTHPAGVNRYGKSTIDVLRHAPGVNLVALFGPEHGIYGDEKANQPIEDRIDSRTGLPVYSLYGKYRKPTPEMLKGLDALVIDLQDLGVRSYTYVSCMRLAMEACFEQGVEVIVLDRPNPLGGHKVDGPFLEEQWKSYVGAYRVPYVHGLTIGELALMAKSLPGWLNISEEAHRKGKLTVIPMKGWTRNMLWPDTGLNWVPTSPAIPDLSAAMGYSMTGLGAQLGGFQHGYGTAYPFRLLTYPNKSPEQIKAALDAEHIPGIELKVVDYKDARGKNARGVYVIVTDWQRLRPTEISFHMMRLAARWSHGNPFADARDSQANLFNKHVGSTEWWKELVKRGENARVEQFINDWATRNEIFRTHSRKFHIYQ